MFFKGRKKDAFPDPRRGGFLEFAGHSSAVYILTEHVPSEMILYANPAFEKTWGFSARELIDSPRLWLDRVDIQDRPRVLALYENFLWDGGRYNVEYRITDKDGVLKWVHDEGFPVEMPKGKVPRSGRIIHDITERKKIEFRNRELVDAKANFVSMVTHELRTPLAAIKESVALVLDEVFGPVNEKQKEFLGAAKRNADRLHSLIDGVLDFQSLNGGTSAFHMKEHDLNDAIREVLEAMKLVADRKGLKLELTLDKDLPLVRFDREKILQVLTNLLHNAIKFTERGGVMIRTSQRGNIVQVSMTDTGPGISPDEIRRIFQSFQQLEKVGEKRAGSPGLGLAICHEIILRHFGKIWAESESGKGSTFFFVLPVNERRNR
ncbi:MAG TPA: PAS domain-containing sensor histidine kinase [Candidatus Omnitrophota bacterium]|nr:PAS domain-containing sensor histidine kinase [Candidatus Omnitrophota bacterium]HPS37506.1 PAS domain-containing sensor histidine kinase [Candidatus Omnitrophota bacterium]